MAEKKLKVVVTGDASGAVRAMGQVDKGAGKMDKSMSKLKSVGKGVGLAGAAGIMSLVAMGPELVNLSGQIGAWAIKTDTVFEKSAGSVRDWAASNATAFGVTDEELSGMAASFGDLLKPMGFTSAEVASMSTKVVGLSGALSEWSGGQISSAEASDILAKAMLGERDGLKQLGISISEADVTARLAKKGQEGLTGAALEQAKALATQELIFEKSTDAQKAYAEGGNETIRSANKLKRAWGEVQVFLAEKLVPIMVKLFDWFQKHKPVAIALAAVVGTTLVAAFLAWAASVIAATWPIVLIVAAIALLALGLIWAYKNVDWFREAVDKAAVWIRTSFLPAIKTMWTWFSQKILPILKLVAKFWGTYWITQARVAVAAIGWLIDKGKILWAWFSRNILPSLKSTASYLAGGLSTALGSARTAMQWVVEKAVTLYSWFESVRSRASSLAFTVAGGLSTAMGTAKTAFNTLKDAAVVLWDKLNSVWNKVKDIASSIADLPSSIPIVGGLFDLKVGESDVAGVGGIALNGPSSGPSLNAGGGRSTTNIYLTVEGSVVTERQLAEVVRNAATDAQVRTGRPWIPAV